MSFITTIMNMNRQNKAINEFLINSVFSKFFTNDRVNPLLYKFYRIPLNACLY